MRILFVRHGETDHNVARRIQGPLIDDPLNAHGRAQAERLEREIAQMHARGDARVRAVYSSPMKRAWMTAEAVARGAGIPEVTPLPGMIEFSWGIYLGRTETDETLAAMKKAHAEWHSGNLDYELPQGESPASAWRRAAAALEPLVARHLGQDIAIVAHGRINKIVLSSLVANDMRRMDEFPQGNTALSLVERVDGGSSSSSSSPPPTFPPPLRGARRLDGPGIAWRLHYVNRKEHLDGLDPKAPLAEGPDSPLV